MHLTRSAYQRKCGHLRTVAPTRRGPFMRQPPWSLVQYTVPTGSGFRLGLMVGEKVRAAPAELTELSLLDVLDDWSRLSPALRSFDAESLDRLAPVPAATLVAPLTSPRKVLCAGANYYRHAEEM